MSQLDHWAKLIWLLCLASLQQEADSYCGNPLAYGGQTIQAYLDNKSENLVLPWTVAIRYGLGEFKCLGSIIPDSDCNGKHKNASRLVLTAGTCFRHVWRKSWGSPSSYKVFAGLDRLRLFFNRGQDAEPQAIRVMPFNAVNENIWNGIALVTLKKPFIFNKEVSPVCLAGTYAVPSDTAKCFVSTYHSGRLDEEVVRMAPGSVCKFGHFPELVRANGLCSLHDKSDTEKSLGGPLVCLINGQAFQFGVYLSELITKGHLSSQKQALHFYGHVSSVFDRTPAALLRYIELGLIVKPTSPSSPASRPGQGCNDPPPGTPTGRPGKPAPAPWPKPAKPVHPAPPRQEKPVYCGDTSTFGRPLESYVVGNDAQDMFPWNVIITSNIMGSIKCIGSLVHKGEHRQIANSSDIILTGADCFSSCGTASAKSQLRVYVGSSRFSRLRRSGTKVKISDVNLYGLRWGGNQMRGGVAIVKLERPLVRKDNVVPVCLAPKDSLPPPSASCYVTHYDTRESRIDEEIVMVTRNVRCLAAQDRSQTEYRGICAIEEKKKHYIQLGSPLICLVDGRAYQYGVYLNQLSLRINGEVKQDMGFYGEISIVHEVFAGKRVNTLPSNSGRQVTMKPEKPPQVSSSSSSSSASRERRRRSTIVVHLPDAHPPRPTFIWGGRSEQKGSKSTSSSESVQQERSPSREDTLATTPCEQSDESTRVITVNVKLIRSRLESILNIKTENQGNVGVEIKPYRPHGNRKPGPCQMPGQAGPNSPNGVLICPTPVDSVQFVPLPTPLPRAEYPSSSLEAVTMEVVPLLPNYDLREQTIAEHEHIKVQDTIVNQTAIAQGSASCNVFGIGGEINSLLPEKSSGEKVENEIDNFIPSVTGAMITGPCTAGDSRGHDETGHLPGASGVHIFTVSGSKIELQCTGTLYVKRGEQYSDEVLTATRCVSSKDARKYKVYIGSLLPRQMTIEQLNRTLIGVASISVTPFYKGYEELKDIGITVLKLKHRVKVAGGVESFPLPYSSTGASSRMECYVSGVCQHGMPVRVRYQLLPPTECKQHLGKKYLPNAMYCGFGQKEILEHPVGSPLLCHSSGNWVHFGIYDHSFPTVASNIVGFSDNEVKPDEVALFVKLEADDAAQVQQ